MKNKINNKFTPKKGSTKILTIYIQKSSNHKQKPQHSITQIKLSDSQPTKLELEGQVHATLLSLTKRLLR